MSIRLPIPEEQNDSCMTARIYANAVHKNPSRSNSRAQTFPQKEKERPAPQRKVNKQCSYFLMEQLGLHLNPIILHPY